MFFVLGVFLYIWRHVFVTSKDNNESYYFLSDPLNLM